MHSYDLERLAQDNSFLTSSNSAVMIKLAHITVMMNAIQAQLKTFSSATTKPTRANRKYYCWSFVNNYTHENKTCLYNKAVNKEDAYYKKKLEER